MAIEIGDNNTNKALYFALRRSRADARIIAENICVTLLPSLIKNHLHYVIAHAGFGMRLTRYGEGLSATLSALHYRIGRYFIRGQRAIRTYALLSTQPTPRWRADDFCN